MQGVELVEYSGKLIVFEGPDGAGKTTQVKLAAERLQRQGYSVVMTREPGGTRLSEVIRQVLLDPGNREMSPVTEALLYAGARSQLVAEVILPALASGKIVLCDRFVDSSLAYQGFGRGLDLEMLRQVNRFALNGLGRFCTIFLDLPPEEGLKRGNKRKRDRLEQEDLAFHRRVWEGYHLLIKEYPERIRVVDASSQPEAVHRQIWKHLSAFLKGSHQGGVF
ncbi:MAG: dTMP kinase [Thermacetogeniaceae bacterium]